MHKLNFKKAQSELKENGKLIIGIENRLGLKYIMGARDDHHGFKDVTIYGNEFAKNFSEKIMYTLENA